MQFQAGASLMASVTDDDGPGTLTNVRWQWYRSSSKTSMGTEIDGATSATYVVSDTSTSNDVGMYLRAMATYSDRRGPNKTATALVSDYPVQAARKDNSEPKFPSATATRSIPEGASGRAVGAPVRATDADGDMLNYTIADNDNFSINQKTGQITTKALLDFSGDDTNTFDTDEYDVIVTATDSAGEVSAPTVTVTITVTDVNDKPTFSTGPEGMAPDHTEAATDAGATVIGAADYATYTATDPEGANVELSLSGDDKDMFELASDTDGGAGATQVLSFKEKPYFPDFEMPEDKNKDNIYKVTVVASDGEMTEERSLTVKVVDTDEMGMVELSSQDALIGVELTATLKDSDGGVPDPAKFTGVTWVWERDDDTTNAETNSGDEEVISGATSASYTPTTDDRGIHLRAIAMYTDRTYDEDNDDDTIGMSFMNTAVSDSTTPVRNNPMNQAPKFGEGASTFRVVEENTMALMGATGQDDADDDDLETDNVADNVGEPVMATDDDDDMPTYTLSGTDAAMFRIRSTGQIEVGDKAKLDYEKKNRYMVTVIADDGYGGANSTASIMVTIHVTDLDEAPEIMDRADRNAMGEKSVTYEENDDKWVLRLSAKDPEGVTPIVWSKLDDATETQDLGIVQVPEEEDDVADADIADRALFDINDDGELTFKSPPSYEDDSIGATYPGITDDSKTYRVVVQASDGGTADDQLNWFKVAVTVTDEEEDGKVSWTVDHNEDNTADIPKLMQFQAGANLMASVTDDDGTPSNVRWQWYRSSSKTSMGTAIAGATSATYTATDSGDEPDEGGDDRGKYIHVKATYDVGNGDDETATLASDYPVRAIRTQENSVPEFSSTAISRRLTEGASGRDVGAPVRATDADNDVLNYTLAAAEAGDNGKYKIDQKSGQITTAMNLDFETETKETDGTVKHEVTVTATDSAGEASDPTVTVTITVSDVNDKPTFTAGPEGMAPDHTEAATDAGATVIGAADYATYTATDPEGANVELSLSGDDKDMFELASDTDGGAGATQVLSFKEKPYFPDFEMPEDKNKDNIYKVTVVATDGSGMTAMRSLTVKVVDTDEMGMVELSSQDALIGVELTATLKDSDGGVPDPAKFTGQKWQWYSLIAVDTDLDSATEGDVTKRAASPSYTPVAADKGRYLKAMVTYTDRTYDEDNVATDNNDDAFMSFMNTVVSDSTTPVRNNPANQAPKFGEGASTFRVVEENTMALMGATGQDDADDDDLETDNVADNVGEPVTATDDNDMPTYTLSGTDAAMFRIRSTGQIEVGDKAMLDYETKNRYMVTVTATDSSNTANNTASIDVTIHVTDLDEAPMIVVGALAISGPPTNDYAENGTGAVYTYTADGPNADMARWTLEGDDAGEFSISGGMLSFTSVPDYENPTDADIDNTYMVTVKANDGTYMDDQAVMVMVTNMEELGTLSGPEGVIDYAENGTGAVGTYSTDGPVSANWSLEGDDASDFSISGGMLSFLSNLPDYEDPADADTDNTYMVTVKAEAGSEMDMATVTINVTDMNEAPMFAAGMDTRSVAENTAAGENVGDPVMAMDEDEGDTLTYALGGDDAASFAFDEATGQISVGEGTELDFESDMTTYTVTVTATDSSGLSNMVTVTINVTNVNDHMPMFADDMAEFSVAENAAAGTDVGMVTATDADDDSLMYSDDSMYFDVDPETGQIMVAEGAMLDYEMEDMHTVTVTASDGESSDSIMVTIMVTDMNEAPMFDFDLDEKSVAENTAAGENVGDPVMAMDEDEGDTLTYALGGDDAASFAIDAATGQIMVGEGTELDFESEMTTYTVTVTATDSGDLTAMAYVAISVTDMNEAPMFDFDMAEKSVAENTDAGENIGDPVAAMDVDADDTLTYTLGGEDMDSFDIDSATGQLMTSADLDYETEDSYSVTVTATDSGGLTAMAYVTISVTDVVETMCSNTVAVGDAASAGLVADCEALLRAMPKLLAPTPPGR